MASPTGGSSADSSLRGVALGRSVPGCAHLLAEGCLGQCVALTQALQGPLQMLQLDQQVPLKGRPE